MTKKMLFDATRHEPITSHTWSEEAAKAEIDAIIYDINTAAKSDGSWPTHPLDAESYPKPGPKWAMYAGAAGVILALQILKRYGYKTDSFSQQLPLIHASYLKNPDVNIEAGLQLGEVGLLIPAVLSQPDNKELTQRLLESMIQTLNLPLYEITSGQTGTMHAALYLYRKTAEHCWKDVYVRAAQTLLDNWNYHDDNQQWLWQSHVFGPTRHYYGACHGIAGNANILLQGMDLLPEDYSNIVIQRAVSTLHLSATTEADMANWRLCTKPDINKLLVQWCHGAAGVITAMAATPKHEPATAHTLDTLLKMAAELVWYAGPLIKGSNICHGTSGNGYAFLYLYKRWGDPIWLDRARKFAIHAIEQCQQARRHFGHGRYSLWTGDAGLAIYLHHCLYSQEAAIPGLELF